MMSKKIEPKRSGEAEKKDRPARPEEETEFVNGCYYAPWDF